jgi:hypothetical protein
MKGFNACSTGFFYWLFAHPSVQRAASGGGFDTGNSVAIGPGDCIFGEEQEL